MIEHRYHTEILPANHSKSWVDALNFVFDVTSVSLITEIVTGKRVIESPDARKIQALIEQI
ncbi:MAG: hypothetical protein A6F72_06265 [Cycloclasticus sp. symbiont of Poecilosclerida sp. N]|nr:MAG: hypothetical protein A6F72_06265 [Cycloclasticus sp. symbiont of Poecilosclerida sp. N]